VCDITNYDTFSKKNRVTLLPVLGQKTACRFSDLSSKDPSGYRFGFILLKPFLTIEFLKLTPTLHKKDGKNLTKPYVR
jgi:hypothetical protein